MTPAYLELAASGPDPARLAAAGPDPARLDPGRGGTRRWPVADGTTIGRSTDAEVTLAVPEVSREHASLRRHRSGWTLTDLDSRNGTWVDGERLGADPVSLASGASIVVAGRVTLRFVDLLATPMAPAIGRVTGLWFDLETRAVWIDAQRVEPPLSDRQLGLLELLYSRQGEVVDRATVIAEVWSEVAAEGVSDDAVSALVKRLRARLAEYETGVRHIEVVRGRGLRLRNP